MFKKVYAVFVIEFIRLLLWVLFSHPAKKREKKDVNNSIEDLMKLTQQNLVKSQRLNQDLTKGPVPGPTKSIKKLINAFEKNRYLLEEDEQEFYLQVARVWAGGLFNNYYIALICSGIFLVTYLSTFLLYPYLSGWSTIIWMMILFFSAIIGIINALCIEGGIKWLLLLLNVFFFIIFIMIMS
ncbi:MULTISPECIES: hypothetical protein [Salimicrobium]|uniref:Uncharacterized protein n=1 Tax=Salimicrobium humidisoli TaxID=2029857 RepID=A0ABX4HNQ5_9BACI|nr:MULTISPECIES: hypothetical protein [Salimicrobium]PBB04837.1 hypothetical protein CKW00_11865 [Salimicrobium humidisoli]